MQASFLSAVVIGLVAGFLSGQFGIGGAIITTPAIRLILQQPELIAVGTPLPVTIPTAVAGAYAYWRKGLVDVRLGLITGVLGGVFAIAGALVSDLVGGQVVLAVTAAFILWTAADMIRSALRLKEQGAVRQDHSRRREHSWPWLLGLGIVAGLYSGFLGLGGGLIITPALTHFFGEDIKRAIGTSLTAVSVLAIPGSVTHYCLGHVDLGLALALSLGVIPGALLGARATMHAKEKNVRIGFAALLLVAGVILAVSEVGRM